MHKKNILVVLIILVSLSATILSFDFPQNETGFKNLKVLPKDITKKQLDSTMSFYSIALGVRCGFCHARNADTTKRGLDFASDAKEEKSRSREMFHLTAYINKNYFNEEHSKKTDTIKTVTCFTCHRGSHEPTANNLLDQFNTIKEERKKK